MKKTKKQSKTIRKETEKKILRLRFITPLNRNNKFDIFIVGGRLNI